MTKKKRTPAELYRALKALVVNKNYSIVTQEWRGHRGAHTVRHNVTLEERDVPGSCIQDGFPSGSSTQTKKFQSANTNLPASAKANRTKRTDNDLYLSFKALAEENGCLMVTEKWLGRRVEHVLYHIASKKEYLVLGGAVNSGFPVQALRQPEYYKKLKELAEENGCRMISESWLGAHVEHDVVHIATGKFYGVLGVAAAINQFPLLDGQRYVTQEVCRQIFVHIYGGEFKTNRSQLFDRNGRSLELDGYEDFTKISQPFIGAGAYTDKNGEHTAFNSKIAFEFQGHRNHQEDGKTIARDKLKAESCNKNGIFLIQIETPTSPIEKTYFYNNIRNSEFMYSYVCAAIEVSACKFGLSAVFNFPKDFKLDLSTWNPDIAALKDLQDCASASGFECLEIQWLGSKAKHRFLHLESGKNYEGNPNQVMGKQGFPRDLRLSADMFIELIACATAAGFECLETKWLGADKKHRFLNAKTRQPYEGVPSAVMSKDGFPKDLRTDADRFAELIVKSTDAGFECLETEWRGSKTKYRFVHIRTQKPFTRSPGAIKSRGFPKDLRTNFDRLAELIACSTAAGFECLETEWLGAHAPHRFLHKKSQKYYSGTPAILISKIGFPRDFRTPADRLAELIACAAAAGFECLETEWLGTENNHSFLHIESQKPYAGIPHKLMSKVGFPSDLRTNADRFSDLIDCSTAAGFKCLETEWLGSKTKHRFLHIESQKKCDEYPHKFREKKAVPRDFKTSTDRLSELIACSTTAGFECLETEWLGAFVKHRFLHTESQKLREWVPSQVMGKLGFPKDLRTSSDRFAELVAHSAASGFKCLESEWLGTDNKYRFLHIESQKNYVGTAYAVMGKQGFPKDLRTDADRFAELTACATSAGFVCLEAGWLGSGKKHRFLHINTQKPFEGNPGALLGTRGFPCDLRTDANRLAELISYSTAAGFECLETEWLGTKAKYRFLHIETQKHYAGTPDKVMSKRGFPKDLRTDVDRLAELVACSTAAGFVCLETEWLGSHTTHRFLSIRSQKTYEGLPSLVMSNRGFPSRASAGTHAD